MNRDRAYRRHQALRMKHRVRAYYGGVHQEEPRRIGLVAHTRALCSCWRCGNPRSHFGEPTLQERRAFQEGLQPS